MKRILVATAVIGLVIIAGLAAWYFRGAGADKTLPLAPPASEGQPAMAPSSGADYPVSFEKPKKVKRVKEVHPGAPAYLDTKRGFRDVAFGAAETGFSDLVLLDADLARELKTYSRSNDVRSLNGMPLESIEYTFFKGQFFRATLRWKLEHPENPNFEPKLDALARDCYSLYGRPRQRVLREDGAGYVWRGRKVELILDGINRVGLTNAVKKTWEVPPTETGRMTILDRALRLDAEKFAGALAQGVKNGT